MERRSLNKGATKYLCFVLFLLFFSLISLDNVNSQPPFQQGATNFDTGLEIKYPQFEYIRQESDFEFNFHAYNISDGLIKDDSDTSCNLHLYNDTGNHILEQDLSFDTDEGDFEITIKDANFTRVGTYQYITTCNTSSIGGFISVEFEVIGSESTLGSLDSRTSYISLYIFFTILAILLILLGFNREDVWLLMMAGFIFSILGLLMYNVGIPSITNTFMMDSITIVYFGIGAYFILRPAMELAQKEM